MVQTCRHWPGWSWVCTCRNRTRTVDENGRVIRRDEITVSRGVIERHLAAYRANPNVDARTAKRAIGETHGTGTTHSAGKHIDPAETSGSVVVSVEIALEGAAANTDAR